MKKEIENSKNSARIGRERTAHTSRTGNNLWRIIMVSGSIKDCVTLGMKINEMIRDNKSLFSSLTLLESRLKSMEEFSNALQNVPEETLNKVKSQVALLQNALENIVDMVQHFQDKEKTVFGKVKLFLDAKHYGQKVVEANARINDCLALLNARINLAHFIADSIKAASQDRKSFQEVLKDKPEEISDEEYTKLKAGIDEFPSSVEEKLAEQMKAPQNLYDEEIKDIQQLTVGAKLRLEKGATIILKDIINAIAISGNALTSPYGGEREQILIEQALMQSKNIGLKMDVLPDNFVIPEGAKVEISGLKQGRYVGAATSSAAGNPSGLFPQPSASSTAFEIIKKENNNFSLTIDQGQLYDELENNDDDQAYENFNKWLSNRVQKHPDVVKTATKKEEGNAVELEFKSKQKAEKFAGAIQKQLDDKKKPAETPMLKA